MDRTTTQAEHRARRLRVLVVADGAPAREAIASALGYAEITAVATARAAIVAAIVAEHGVAVIDHRLPDVDALALVRKLKNLPRPPRVLLFSPGGDPHLALAALVCGADGIADGGELSQAVMAVTAGGRRHPALAPDTMREVAARLDATDAPILGMLMNAVPPGEIAAVLGISRGRLEARRHAILERLLALRSAHRARPRRRAATARAIG